MLYSNMGINTSFKSLINLVHELSKSEYFESAGIMWIGNNFDL
jgi:hypothetical protein